DVATGRQAGQPAGKLEQSVLAPAPEQPVRLLAYENQEVARRPALPARVALAVQREVLAFRDAGGNLHVETRDVGHASLTAALQAGGAHDLPLSVPARAEPDAHKLSQQRRADLPHLALALAIGAARAPAARCPGALARLACLGALQANALGRALGDLLEGERELDLEILPAAGAGARPAARGLKQIFEAAEAT